MTIQRLLAKMASFTLLCVLFTQAAFSQTKTVSGTVTDDKGAPIQGATITVKGTRAGTSTAVDGKFTLSVPSNATTLVVTSVGFSSQEVAIANQTSFSVTLTASQANLNEVVVIGYGTAKKKDFA